MSISIKADVICYWLSQSIYSTPMQTVGFIFYNVHPLYPRSEKIFVLSANQRYQVVSVTSYEISFYLHIDFSFYGNSLPVYLLDVQSLINMNKISYSNGKLEKLDNRGKIFKWSRSICQDFEFYLVVYNNNPLI